MAADVGQGPEKSYIGTLSETRSTEAASKVLLSIKMARLCSNEARFVSKQHGSAQLAGVISEFL